MMNLDVVDTDDVTQILFKHMNLDPGLVDLEQQYLARDLHEAHECVKCDYLVVSNIPRVLGVEHKNIIIINAN